MDGALANALAQAQQAWGLAQLHGYELGDQLTDAVELVRRTRMTFPNSAATTLPPTAGEMAKMKPDQLAKRLREAALDRVAAAEAATVVEEWRTQAAGWLVSCVLGRMSEWIPALARDFDAAVSTLRDLTGQLPGRVNEMRPETLDADTLTAWRRTHEAVNNVERILGTRTLFAALIGEDLNTQRYGSLAPLAMTLAPVTNDPALFEDQWRPRHEAFIEAGQTTDPPARWAAWLDLERRDWVTIAMATNNSADRVAACDTFANLGNAWVTSDGGASLAARVGQLAGWHTIRGGVAA